MGGMPDGPCRCWPSDAEADFTEDGVEADFPKDEETTPVSTRACARLIEALKLLGVNPDVPTNPVDCAAFILEAIAEAVLRINVKPGQVRDAVAAMMTDPESIKKELEEFDRKMGSLEGDGFFEEPTEEELEALDGVTHSAACRIWDENEETDCDCGAPGIGDAAEHDIGGEG
jgi:hypothetical protein